jgi:hypothetical protein
LHPWFSSRSFYPVTGIANRVIIPGIPAWQKAGNLPEIE